MNFRRFWHKIREISHQQASPGSATCPRFACATYPHLAPSHAPNSEPRMCASKPRSNRKLPASPRMRRPCASHPPAKPLSRRIRRLSALGSEASPYKQKGANPPGQNLEIGNFGPFFTILAIFTSPKAPILILKPGILHEVPEKPAKIIFSVSKPDFCRARFLNKTLGFIRNDCFRKRSATRLSLNQVIVQSLSSYTQI